MVCKRTNLLKVSHASCGVKPCGTRNQPVQLPDKLGRKCSESGMVTNSVKPLNSESGRSSTVDCIPAASFAVAALLVTANGLVSGHILSVTANLIRLSPAARSLIPRPVVTITVIPRRGSIKSRRVIVVSRPIAELKIDALRRYR